MTQLTPREIVRELNRYIIGQDDAKRAVAVALRNRYRRAQLPEDIREEVTPKNILMNLQKNSWIILKNQKNGIRFMFLQDFLMNI